MKWRKDSQKPYLPTEESNFGVFTKLRTRLICQVNKNVPDTDKNNKTKINYHRLIIVYTNPWV